MKTTPLRLPRKSLACFLLQWLCLAMLAPLAQAQWLTQQITLRPGWNAVSLHVTATHETLENLVGADSPISEVWLWQPSAAGRIQNNPSQPAAGSDWISWTRAQGPANGVPLVANATYLVRNSSASAFLWNIKGRPVPPANQWTASGLNFFGFSTRADSAPFFSALLQPAESASPFEIFHYPGGEAVDASPLTAQLFAMNTVRAERGRAVWMRKADNSDNRYFGPFEFVLQDFRGVVFGEAVGAYTVRLRNQLAITNTISVTLLNSENAPGGEVIPAPPILLRTTLDMTNLSYSYESMPVNQAKTFVLSPKGTPGSETQVVLGLDRATMTAPGGTSFAAVLRLQDTTLGHLQIDLPVSARQASTEGLWVGNASITHVGNYLKSYSKATNAADYASQLSQLQTLNETNRFVTFTNEFWNIGGDEGDWRAIAWSLGGSNVVAAAFGGNILTSEDAGTNWVTRLGAPAADWTSLAVSANASNIVAAVRAGRIYTSGDFGATWTAQAGAPIANWTALASSEDGAKLAAVAAGGELFVSADHGQTWTSRAPLAGQNWQALAASRDGNKLFAAAKGGQLHASTNAGLTWAALFGAPTNEWRAVACSADGKMIVAAANPGSIYTSDDSGATWDLKASAPPAAAWAAVASSADGKALAAAIEGGRIFTSPDAGATWTARETSRNWGSLATSADGTRIYAGESAAVGGLLYFLQGELNTPELTYDPASNRILSGGKYLTASFDTELGVVPQPFSLRLIVHNGTNGASRLLQKVFFGPDLVTSNTILTRVESDLNPGLLAKARRISAVHLPLSSDGWNLIGDFGGVGIMNASLTEGYNSQGSNPFVHAYHPDHDNLDALFQPISSPGPESYDIRRQITLSFAPPNDDFMSRTASSSTVRGAYLENIVIKGSANQTRTIVTKGSFVLNRLSSIGNLQ